MMHFPFTGCGPKQALLQENGRPAAWFLRKARLLVADLEKFVKQDFFLRGRGIRLSDGVNHSLVGGER